MLQFRTNIQCTTNKLSTIFTNQIYFTSKTITLKMEPQQHSKRPICPTCTKPLGLCLCTRIKTPNLNNKVHVTILQHSLEKNHPLNSARIAKLGLRNVDVYTVTDVMFEAQFNVVPLMERNVETLVEGECTPSVCENAHESVEFDRSLGVRRYGKRDFDQFSDLDSGNGSVDISDFEHFSNSLLGNIDESRNFDGSLIKKDDHLLEQCEDHKALLSMKIGKYGEISSISHHWNRENEEKTTKIEHLLTVPEIIESLAGGFAVKKLQKKQKIGSLELEQFVEFEITVPPGSVLLFPTQKAVPAEAIDFDVKNLIVLDGTWPKANRMYNENPWLRILPSVRLDVQKMSLFKEVRHQPKPGYLSTIESVVYALKELEGSQKLVGLGNLLDCFASMVEDQRRCKDDRLKKLSI
ncbi:uncharacterized protein LOC130818291 [Amaranthus tricolor]|uniref:uncharacterized protein LOC130818291 n=1 Tax=Amaranthus tricolor TaxID=29722 RepID=UPI00258C44EF|nr:uncharacterized protein LOC130818291 [Amaranthus tricolor]